VLFLRRNRRRLKQEKQNGPPHEIHLPQALARLRRMENAHEQLHLADGSKVIVRVIRPEDGPMLQAFVRRLSARSRYFRFFAGVVELSAGQVDRFLRLDPDRGLAVIAISSKEPAAIVAEARCVLDRGGRSAEFAIAVADEFQRRRLGTQLLNKLLAYASAKGVRRLFGEILADNHGMQAFARGLGFQLRSNPADATTLIAQRVPIGPLAN
jgi:acetyltransferase